VSVLEGGLGMGAGRGPGTTLKAGGVPSGLLQRPLPEPQKPSFGTSYTLLTMVKGTFGVLRVGLV
jgi:hypothetical protein